MKLVASATLLAGAVASSSAMVDREDPHRLDREDPDRPRQGRTRQRVSRASASNISIGATSDIGAMRSPLPPGRLQGNSQLFNPLARNLRDQRTGRGEKTDSASPGRGRDKKSNRSGKSDKSVAGSKTGKSGKSGKSESYHIAPFSCPGRCIDAEGADYNSGELSNAVQSCNVDGSHGYTQQWLVHQDTTFVKVESYAYEGQCIGVFYEPGDSAEDIEGACGFGEDAELALRPCDSTSTNWYFTGGQLLSAFCWLNGFSSTMAIGVDKRKCSGDLVLYGGNSFGDLSREDTFLFVESDVMALMEIETRRPTQSPTLYPTLNPTLSPVTS